MFPRSVNEAPSWLLSQVEKEAAAGGKLSLRQVNVYDDVDATGRPINNRPPVPEEEIPRLLDYLENAPVVLAARGFARDAFDPEGPGQVPLTFHTDGPLVWAGACAYYLRHYGLAPEPDLLTLARSCNFRPPTDVDDRTRNAAVALLTGQPRPIAPSQLSVSSRPQNAQTSTQPFGPLDDADPPLSLFKDRLIVEIPVGTEIDRFGNPSGCVTYEARTLYAHRSLPPDWLKNPYHIYRVVRSFRVLRGTAVSWFGQPGGGTAFVLPRAIEELLADNSLVEVMEDDKK
ncbi:DUF4237 domain-containing protein [Ktedonosporobacter rubrisoli]|uniref:DUF4237 domain-containing protein n=2 Tax=Ktedonosporobacter rubrisoli TaxID=2509675 RepID=A0A4P6K7R6_KTERU|nr:DUF4237 domain-containing protein [Ktedonosporobacter rubrisoli]